MVDSGLDRILSVCRYGKGFIYSSNLMYAYCLRH